MIMVDIYFPAVDATYDFRLDENVRIVSILQEVGEMMSKKYKSSLHVTADEFMLCSLDDNRILEQQSTLQASGVRNGSRLMLV